MLQVIMAVFGVTFFAVVVCFTIIMVAVHVTNYYGSGLCFKLPWLWFVGLRDELRKEKKTVCSL